MFSITSSCLPFSPPVFGFRRAVQILLNLFTIPRFLRPFSLTLSVFSWYSRVCPAPTAWLSIAHTLLAKNRPREIPGETHDSFAASPARLAT
jgi:hypothetical protein